MIIPGIFVLILFSEMKQFNFSLISLCLLWLFAHPFVRLRGFSYIPSLLRSLFFFKSRMDVEFYQRFFLHLLKQSQVCFLIFWCVNRLIYIIRFPNDIATLHFCDKCNLDVMYYPLHILLYSVCYYFAYDSYIMLMSKT